MKKYPIHSIYLATEGEGVRIGTPQVFIRFMGCNIGCVNCDSKDTWDFTEGNMSLEEILARIEEESGLNARRVKSVSITGGDPMHPKLSPLVLELSQALKKKDYFINVEASGMRVAHDIFDFVDFISSKRGYQASFTCDRELISGWLKNNLYYFPMLLDGSEHWDPETETSLASMTHTVLNYALENLKS